MVHTTHHFVPYSLVSNVLLILTWFRLSQNWIVSGLTLQNIAAVPLVLQLLRGNQKTITMKKVMIPSTMVQVRRIFYFI
jgi:hypothetical protein